MLLRQRKDWYDAQWKRHSAVTSLNHQMTTCCKPCGTYGWLDKSQDADWLEIKHPPAHSQQLTHALAVLQQPFARSEVARIVAFFEAGRSKLRKFLSHYYGACQVVISTPDPEDPGRLLADRLLWQWFDGGRRQDRLRQMVRAPSQQAARDGNLGVLGNDV